MLRWIAPGSWLIVAACSSTYLGEGDVPGAQGGSGGTSGVNNPSTPRAGRDNPPKGFPPSPTAGAPGRAGAGGGPIVVPPDMPSVAFSATVRAGGEVVVNIKSARPLFNTYCSNPAVLEKAVTGSWAPLQDDRPPHSNNPGYYLDGRFQRPSQNFGCDTIGCRELTDGERAGRTIEYVQTGTALPPPEPHTWPDAGIPVPVDVPLATIESRGLRGKMRVRVTYFEDSSCTKMRTIDVPFDVGEGLCCLIGPSGCSADGPVGGWAPTEATCDRRALDEDAYYDRRLDPWGCPKLGYDETRCCNCFPDDAGAGE